MVRMNDEDIRKEYITQMEIILNDDPTISEKVKGIAEGLSIKLGEMMDTPRHQRIAKLAKEEEERKKGQEEAVKSKADAEKKRQREQRKRALNQQAYEHLLPIFKREPAAERTVEFVVRFCTAREGDEADPRKDELIEYLCLRLLKLAAVKDKAVRFRVAQIVGSLMNAMPEDAEVSDELFESLEGSMLARCRDKVPVVRAWALKGLFRLQNPQDGSCAITAELLRLMNEDTDKEVRMAAISTLEPSRHAIRALLLRCSLGWAGAISVM